MRSFLTRGRRVFAAGGWILPVILLVLPACTLDTSGTTEPPPIFDPGLEPLSGAIKCDIPAQLMPAGGFPCATAQEVADYMDGKRGDLTADSEAPSWIAVGASKTAMVLDFSKDAFAQCGAGIPRKIEFRDAYPGGTTVCLNCGQLRGGPYTDADAACKAKCKDVFAWEGDDGRGTLTCDTFAKTSPNWIYACKDGLCDIGGNPNNPFLDPRTAPESLVWTDADGVTISPDGDSINFDGLSPGTNPDPTVFRAGAASTQLVPEWDAIVEFAVGETGVTHVLGLRTSCDDIKVCPDANPGVDDLPLVINLHKSNNVFVVDGAGNILFNSDPTPYAAGERFRIRASDQHNGFAQLSFWRVAADGKSESELFWDRDNNFPVAYPLRLDASFREANASINNVTIMRVVKK